MREAYPCWTNEREVMKNHYNADWLYSNDPASGILIGLKETLEISDLQWEREVSVRFVPIPFNRVYEHAFARSPRHRDAISTLRATRTCRGPPFQ